MADPEKKIIDRVAKLFAGLREVQAREYEITEEIQAILGGGASLSDNLKRLEAAFDTIWGMRYAPGQAGRYVWAYKRDRPGMARLLKRLTVEELQERMVNYLKSDDPFYTNARHNFAVFVASINSHASPAQRPQDAPWVCRHEPFCGNRSTCAVVSARPLDKQVFKGEHVL